MKTYDLIVIGAGSGNMLLGRELDHFRTAIVEPGRFGGTCLNRGCIPSKMFVLAADAARAVAAAERLGVHATLDRVDWPAIRARVFDRLDPIHAKAVEYRRKGGIDVYAEPARFVGPHVIEVGGEQLTAPRIVVAAGARPSVPPIAGLDEVDFHTSDTIMRIDRVPRSMIIIGGGFIAAELGHVFDAFGARVTIVGRGPRLLPAEDDQVSARFTELARQRFTVLLDSEVRSVVRRGDGVAVTVEKAGRIDVLNAETLLVATGRRPNTDLLDVAAAGLRLDEHGHLVTDPYCRTSVEGVWSLGDAANHFQLKHMANAEARVVMHNLVHSESPRELRTTIAPHAVFGEPQIASVGLTEQDARRSGVDHIVSVRDYSDTAYGWALEDTTSFVKILADPRTRLLLGAHLIGPQAATLIQPLIQALALGHTVDQISRDILYIHPALTEVIEQALLAL